MSTEIIENRLKEYQLESKQEELCALKEIFQEMALAALARANFFKIAAFQGGTCLRIVHALRRFSEDLDFILMREEPFEWMPFFKSLEKEFSAFGLDLQVHEGGQAEGAIKRAFLKESSFKQVLQLKYPRFPSDPQILKIKLEIDTHPPAGSHFETHFLNYPYGFSIVAQDLPSLFASKCHALLCRPYLKGRDWYDLLWYLRKKICPNFEHLQAALLQYGPYQGKDIALSYDWLQAELGKKVKEIDWEKARQDVAPFLFAQEQHFVENWGKDLFLGVLPLILPYPPSGHH